jgi:single-strand DNA-binding protein
MSTRSLNKVQLIGNMTRDPELRYTPQGTAVCTFGLATNRSWTTEGGEKKEETEFHRIVVWNKLAELCSQLLFKGRRIYIEGRLQTRSWTGQDNVAHQTTEIVASDMLILDNKRAEGGEGTEAGGPEPVEEVVSAEEQQTTKKEEQEPKSKSKTEKDEEKKEEKPEKNEDEGEIKSGDIPF